MKGTNPLDDFAPPFWEKPVRPFRMMREKETVRAYAAFRAYFEMGHARNLSGLAKIVNSSKRSLRRWAKRFRWDERIDVPEREKATAIKCASGKAMERYLLQLARQRTEIAQGSYRLALAFRAKASEIVKIIEASERERNIVSPEVEAMYTTLTTAADILLSDPLLAVRQRGPSGGSASPEQ